MLTKLKCFFGLHEWEHSDQDGPHHGRVLRKRKCLRCGDSQKEIHAENGFYYWRFNPEWPSPPRERPTPKPRETMRDIHGVNAGDLQHSKLPKINVDTPMPECKEPVVYDFCYVVQYKFLPKDPFTIKLFRKQENAQNFKQKCTSQKMLCSLIILDFED